MPAADQRYAVRPATLGDAQPICDLINDVDLVDIGFAEYGPDDVIEDLTAPGVGSTSEDSWLAFDGDRLVAYGVLWNNFGNERIDIDHYVRRKSVPAGAHLIDLMTVRAAEVAAANGAGEAVIHLHLTPKSVLTEAELPARGWRAVRRHQVMRRLVSVGQDPDPVPPAGVTLRTAETPDDQRVVHRILEESFAEHFDNQPQPYEEWRANQRAKQLDWSLVWIAALQDGAGVPVDVGVAVGRNNREAMGWVRDVGVVEPARGRGVATFLLRTAFAEFARRGRNTVGLGVDTENVTGALRLYESLGMTLHFAADTWEVRVPAPAYLR
jgi:GNAT superfamily N-acetyltransferase